MIIIRLRSGLGNQMFQYAFFKQMQKWHGKENVKIDYTTYHWKNHNGLEIDQIFGINLQKDSVNKKVALKYADVGYSLLNRVKRRIRGIKHYSYLFWKDIDFNDYKTLDDVYLEGYWNNEKFFEEIKEEIRDLYTFKVSFLNKYEQSLLNNIEKSESVSIHVRRGDYKKYPHAFPLCTPSYYHKAINFLKNKEKNLKFFIFSDDIKWCKRNLTFLTNSSFIENKNKKEAYKDMMFMSKCKHNIIANSTFSWWSAWLNRNPEKKVFYPKSSMKTNESMPQKWIMVE